MSVRPRTRKDGTHGWEVRWRETAPTDLGCSLSRRMPTRGTARFSVESSSVRSPSSSSRLAAARHLDGG
jgi:hypothetical protein